MAYLKDELSGFVPTEIAQEIQGLIARGSTVLRMGKTTPMKSDKKKVPVMAEGPGAYWVGEGERIKTSKAMWIFPELEAKKLAVIIPVTKEKLEDSTLDVFEELKSAIAESFYTAIDAAALFGTDSPFAKSVFAAAVAADHIIVIGTNSSLDLDVSDTMALVEQNCDVNGFSAHYGVKNDLRKLRDNNGNALYVPGTDTSTLYSEPIEFSRNNAWDKKKAEVIVGDWNKLLIGVKDDIQYEILKEATLQNTVDADGKPLSLAEQDMVAIKATMRIAVLPIKDDAFAVLVPKDYGKEESDTSTAPSGQEGGE